jgi:hypothetical protein
LKRIPHKHVRFNNLIAPLPVIGRPKSVIIRRFLQIEAAEPRLRPHGNEVPKPR